MGMIYSSVSCNVDQTMSKLQSYGVNKMIDMDQISLVTVTDKGKVQVDGSLDFMDKKILCLQEQVEEWAGELYRNEMPLIKEGMCGYCLIVPVREYSNYKIFCISCRQEKAYIDKDLQILKFVVQSIYESVLLDNDYVIEKNYLRQIFDSVASFIIGIDLNDRIISVNSRGLDRFAKENDMMIGNEYQQYISDADLSKISGAIRYAIEKKKTFYFVEEVFLNIKKGKLFSDLTISPLLEADGKATGVVVVGSDKTKQKIYEREIEQLKQFSMLGELATGLAHDIKNPLTSIRGCSKILEKKLGNQQEYMEFIEPIVQQVDRINEVLDQMLSYSYITQKDNYSMIDINDVLEKCSKVITFHSKSKFISIKTEYEPNLPRIQANNVQLQQAFLNILFNAIQAIDTKGSVFIASSKDVEKSEISIEITDDGIGMDSLVLKQIFEPLYTTKNSGHGIGLSIVKRTVNKLNGNISVSSEVGVGTTFRITLPYFAGGKADE